MNKRYTSAHNGVNMAGPHKVVPQPVKRWFHQNDSGKNRIFNRTCINSLFLFLKYILSCQNQIWRARENEFQISAYKWACLILLQLAPMWHDALQVFLPSSEYAQQAAVCFSTRAPCSIVPVESSFSRLGRFALARARLPLAPGLPMSSAYEPGF